jgi:thioesterase domain-containing protein/acyl carrier protein
MGSQLQLGGCVARDVGLAANVSDDQRYVRHAVAGTVRRADLALSVELKEPQSETERKLAEIWREIFTVDIVGTADDFFELGGDSFAATTLAAEIEATFGKRFTPADIITAATIAQQAELLDANRASAQLPACLVLGRAGGAKPPLFMVHGGKGFAFFGPAFFDIVGEERSIYLFQAPGLDGRTSLESVKEMATLEDFATIYVEAMRKVQPTGPYHIAAMCAGSFIAVEMCVQLEKAGETVRRLLLLDPSSVPPSMKPSAIQALKEKKRAKRASRQGLGGRIVAWLKGAEAGGETAAEETPWEMTPNNKEELQQRIQQRVEQMTDLPPEKRSFTAERMFKISEQLRTALYTYVPRAYPGKAVLLVSGERAKNTLAEKAFWPNNLGSMQCEVLGDKHKDLFEEKLAETGRFVKNVLS